MAKRTAYPTKTKENAHLFKDLPDDECFKYMYAHYYNVSKALRLIEAGLIPFEEKVISVQEWGKEFEGWSKKEDGRWQFKGNIMLSTSIKPEHALGLTPEQLEKPGLFVMHRFHDPKTNGKGEVVTHYPVQADGHHRLFRKLQDGVAEMKVYLISDEAALALIHEDVLAGRRSTQRLNKPRNVKRSRAA